MNRDAPARGSAYIGFGSLAVLSLLGIITYPAAGLSIMGAAVAAAIIITVRVDRVALYCGCAALTLLMLVPVQNIGGFGSLKIGVLCAVAALAVAGALRRWRSFRDRPAGLWLFLVYLCVLALATPRSDSPSSWNLLIGAAVAGLSISILFVLMNPEERKSALNFVVFLASCEAAYALFELVAKRPPLWGYWSVGSSGAPNIMVNQIDTALIRSQGTLGHPLPLALLLLAGLALVIRGAGPKRPILRVAVFGLLAAGCFAAGSRSAMLVAVVLLFLAIGTKRRLIIAGAGSLLLVLTVLIAAAAGFFQSEVYERFVASDSLSHRNGALDAVPGLLTNQDLVNVAFGNGYYSAPQLFREGMLQVGNFYAVDNQAVMTLVEGGLVGLAILATLIVLAIIRIDVAARMGLLSVAVFFFSFDVLSWPSGMTLFGMFIGLAFSAKKALNVGASHFEEQAKPAITTRVASATG
ncbi:hypothetical protein [Pseudarthrobacter sp. BRE9]|uniref:O-antigen ligase family protein n=1 Tax=Pseudarthrobacter sp. BRE9 TaxID=2962582 RepID=UPI002882AD49|nr:hypothetical protein [Pseudarthrobacter sp. BRE9]MDT0168114.1 hypothetical protein [Pseudarthrobacter sp. BRE9]